VRVKGLIYLFDVFFDNLPDPLKDPVDRCNHFDRTFVDLVGGVLLLLVEGIHHVGDNQTKVIERVSYEVSEIEYCKGKTSPLSLYYSTS